MRRSDFRSRSFLSTTHISSTVLSLYVLLGCFALIQLLHLSVCQLLCTATQIILLPPTTVNKNIIQRHRKMFFQARYNLLQPKEWRSGMVSLQEALLPQTSLELPRLLLWGWSQTWHAKFGDEVTVLLAFRQPLCLTQLTAPLISFCQGINALAWWRGFIHLKDTDLVKKKGSANFTVMWKKQLPVMTHCPSCLWAA